MDLLVSKSDLHDVRIDRGVGIEGAADSLADGDVLLKIDRFALTANNITYAVFGEAMRYWQFFPAEDDAWGRVPVWGFADVAASRHPGVPVGTRFYGYYPMSTHLVVTPDRATERGFVDSVPHRADLPPVYNAYRAVAADASYDERFEAHQMLLSPLFFTSWLIDDFLADHDFFSAGTAVLSSASSKTTIGTAFLLARRDGLSIVGLTSPRNAEFVTSLDTYSSVVGYDEVTSIPDDDALYVDVAGDGALREAVHRHFGDRLSHSAVVGATHWNDAGTGSGELPGPTPTLFFAPDQIDKRTAVWGREELDDRIGADWTDFVAWTDGWLEVVRGDGVEAAERTYRDVLDGSLDPKVGHVVSMWD